MAIKIDEDFVNSPTLAEPGTKASIPPSALSLQLSRNSHLTLQGLRLITIAILRSNRLISTSIFIPHGTLAM